MKTGYLMIEGTGKKRDQHLRTIRAAEGHMGWKVNGGYGGLKRGHGGLWLGQQKEETNWTFPHPG